MLPCCKEHNTQCNNLLNGSFLERHSTWQFNGLLNLFFSVSKDYLINLLRMHVAVRCDGRWWSCTLPGLLCQLQGSEGFVHSCSQHGLVLQHLAQNRSWQLQQHTWENTHTHTGLRCILRTTNQILLIYNTSSPVSFPAVSLCLR